MDQRGWWHSRHHWLRPGKPDRELAKLQRSIFPTFLTDQKDKLGEVVYIELPSIGAKFEKAAQFATLESVKAVSECYMPASGTVREINKALQENPSQINKSPFDEGLILRTLLALPSPESLTLYLSGWLVKIDLGNKAELGKLMNETQYNEFLKSDQDH